MECHNSYLYNQPKKGETLYMNKKLIAILSSIIVLLLLASGLYYFFGSSNSSIKEEHDKYLALINDNHDFKGGLAGLETLDNDKGQEAFKNIKTEIKIAKELKNADSSLDNKDVDAAKKSLEKVDSLTTDNSFDKAIEWLKEDITNYEKALKEIKEAKSDDVNSILDKYKFKHSALKAELSNKNVKQTEVKDTPEKSAENKDTSPSLSFAERVGKNYEYYADTIRNDVLAKSKRPDGIEAPTDGIDVSYRTFDKNNNLIMLNYTARDPQYNAIILFKLNNDGTCSLVEYGSLQRTIATYKAIY